MSLLPQLTWVCQISTNCQQRAWYTVLSPGEAILFITDGVTEAENEESELFGDGRLADYFEVANGPPYTKGLLERIGSWRGNAAMNDDLTMVEIWRDPPR